LQTSIARRRTALYPVRLFQYVWRSFRPSRHLDATDLNAPEECEGLTKFVWTSFVVALALTGAAMAQEVVDDPCEKGQLYFQDDNYIAAEPFLRQCLESEESLRALLPLTVIAVLQERATDGIALGQRALALAPDNPRVRYWYGRAQLIAGNPTEAMAQWEEGLQLDVNHAGILEGLARLSLEQGNDARAYNLLLQLRMQSSDALWLHRMLSNLARRRGLWDRAATHWQDVVELDGESEENLVVLGELNILAGENEKAVEIFQHAVQVIPSGATWGGLGEAWFAMNEIDSARVALERAVELAPENPHNRFNLANTMQIMGDLEGAEQQFVTYLEARPDDPVGHFKYGVHLELRGEEERGLAEVEKAVSLDSRYIEALVVLAQMYEKRGRTEETLSTIGRLEQLDPGAQEELAAWRARVEASRAEVESAVSSGKVHLLHIVTASDEASQMVTDALASGEDFASLATRFSTGPTAVRGGDIGWVLPADLMPGVQDAVRDLAPGEVTAPIAAGGATHFFKRLR
jgi:tetratricopeptide (TPR) repeat protein